ncbi:DNA-processing protein DprA [Bacillus safensis]|nr:DNA-processing protein DprA [Bacillus safensis]PLT37714.1 DNA-processing protein DprA [Bacillus safensis]
MSIKEMLLILYDLGLSNRSLSRLFKEINENQFRDLLEGEFLDIQFSNGIFDDNEIELLSDINLIKESVYYIKNLLTDYKTMGITYSFYYEDDYPTILKYLNKPPFFIFMYGNKAVLDQGYKCSIVGTRNPSEMTIKQIELVVKEMVANNIITVSGLAKGTDTYVHHFTLKYLGKTVAVLPSPITDITPKANKVYIKEILRNNGLIISEYYKKDKTFKKSNFIDRNRIISGISNSVIIAECSERSGTMHTARFAFKQNKPLYCFNNNSPGVVKILKSKSAKVYSSIRDLGVIIDVEDNYFS